jgi:hypothetical protein
MQKGQPIPTDSHESSLLAEVALCCRKIERFTKGISQEELQWTPPGVNNSLSWLLRHLAATLWICHSLAAGSRMNWDPCEAGIQLSSVRGIDHGSAKLPTPTAREPMKYIKEAYQRLATVFKNDNKVLEDHLVYADRKWRKAWWFVAHELGDFAYHTGQASYLRKVIAAQRLRKGPK